MRNLSAAALTKIANQYGNEPVVILDIAWADNITKQYADRDIDTIPGRILEVSDLDNIINVTESADSQEISIILDDTDGSIKTIMNTYDIHKRDVWVYQWFDGLNINDRFLLFRGKISSPVEWNEGERTVSFTVISQLEDKEVGFSPEEGQFPHIPKDLIGKTWPSIFGRPLDVPAVQISRLIEGTTLNGVGIVSGKNHHLGIGIGGVSGVSSSGGPTPPDTRLAQIQMGFLIRVINRWGAVSAKFNIPGANEKIKQYNKQYEQIRKQVNEAYEEYRRARRCAASQRNTRVLGAIKIGEDGETEKNKISSNPIKILNLEDFPSGTITLNINGGYFTGYKEGNYFYVKSRCHLEHEAEIRENLRQTTLVGGSVFGKGSTGSACKKQQKPSPYHFEAEVPTIGKRYDTWHFEKEVSSGSLSARDRGDQHSSGGSGGGNSGPPQNIMKHFWADAGSRVSLAYDQRLTYIVSIIPGTVLQVKAYKDFHGDRRLVNIPNELWSTFTKTYGSITTVQIRIHKALSTIEGQNWAGDDIYVTFRSSVGPNIIDILEYLINRYSDLTIDAASFAAVKIKLAKFPANFALLDRKNIVETLQEIAFQARCSLRISNGVFYLNYLPEEPTAIDTLTENDIENQSVIVSLTSTEDLVTKFVAQWRLSYAQEDLDKIVLRHNVNKYGIQEEEYEFYIYNQPDIIFKIATFWLIRKANSWKKLKCNVFLNKLNLETFDAVTFDFDKDYVSNNNVKAIIEQAIFDSENQIINLECWIPIKAGSMDEYPFAWPADEEADALFPTKKEYDAGNAGGDGIGADAVGNLPVGQVPVGDTVIYVGGTNVIFGPQTDHGDPYPSDTDFSAQSLRIDAISAEINSIMKPLLNLSLNYADDSPDLDLPELPRDLNILSLETPVMGKEEIGFLGDFLKFGGSGDKVLGIKLEAKIINADDEAGALNQAFILAGDEGEWFLAIKTDVKVYDGEDIGVFHFKFDTEGEKWGAGTAFLQDEESS